MNDSRSVVGLVGETLAVRASIATAATLHRKHGAALFVGVDSDVRVRAAGGRWLAARAIVVPPDVAHETACAGPTLGLLYDPERWRELAAFTRSRGNRPFVLDGRAAEHVGAIVTSERARVFGRDALDGIARAFAGELPKVRAPPIDARVAETLERLRCGAPTDEVAAISPAHLRALFARDVGLSMRAYRLWRKLLRATALMASSDVTTAAHAAEFADLAHFSRTCRRLLGHSPTILRRGADGVRGIDELTKG